MTRLIRLLLVSLLVACATPRITPPAVQRALSTAPVLPVPWDEVERWASAEDLQVARDPQCAEVSRREGDLQVLSIEWGLMGGASLTEDEAEIDRNHEEILVGHASMPDPDRLYLLVDDSGGLAVVRATGVSRAPAGCYDDCPSFWLSAPFQIPPRRRSRGVLSAVGPLPGALVTSIEVAGRVNRRTQRWESRAQLPRKAHAPADGQGWRAVAWFDLDGDDQVDVVVRNRDCGCEHLAVESLVRDWDGEDWRVTERFVHLPLPYPPNRCGDDP